MKKNKKPKPLPDEPQNGKKEDKTFDKLLCYSFLAEIFDWDMAEYESSQDEPGLFLFEE